MNRNALYISNSTSADISDIPVMNVEEFSSEILSLVAENCRVVSFFGVEKKNDETKIIAVLANDETGLIALISTNIKDSYKSLTPECPQVHLFERELYEQWNVEPEGHPCLKEVRFPTGTPCLKPYQIEGEQIHEVAVGPVHAGVIEPGHFRFQCHGETVHHLEISLGYQYRGIEKALLKNEKNKTQHYIETAAGDTTVGYSTAYAQAMEALSGISSTPSADIIRAVALELERLACHTGDLGALAGDVAYLPTASFCGRIRGDFLNMTALLCGNRFARNLIKIGGVKQTLEASRIEELKKRLDKTFKDAEHAINLLWKTSSVMTRFKNTGVVSEKTSSDLGLVGVSARACGINNDARTNFKTGAYKNINIPAQTCNSGDVYARAFVRFSEMKASYDFIKEALNTSIDSEIATPQKEIAKNKIAVSLVEGWRGEICHTVLTNDAGEFLSYKITDPSFHNWTGLAMSLRGEEISDFPLCNKSFNLSYCGHDL